MTPPSRTPTEVIRDRIAVLLLKAPREVPDLWACVCVLAFTLLVLYGVVAAKGF